MLPVLINARVQTIFYVYTANAIVCMLCVLMGSIPYYDYIGKNPTILSFLFSATMLSVTYMLMAFFIEQKRFHIAIGCLVAWILSGIGFVGFLSALVINISPLQFVTLCMAQSLCIVVHTRLSTRKLSIRAMTLSCIGISVFVWCISIYGFVVEGDWMAAVIILLLSFFVVIYNHRFIHLTGTNKYDTTWQSTVTALMHYYSYDAMRFIQAVTLKFSDKVHNDEENADDDDDIVLVESGNGGINNSIKE